MPAAVAPAGRRRGILARRQGILNHDLDRLSAEEQRAAELVHSLVSAIPKGTPGRDLLPFVGTIDDESARQMIEAIEEECERVDLDEW